MSTAALKKLLPLASDQHGVLTRAQAREVGISDGQIKRLLASGLLDRPQREVLRMVGAEPTWLQTVWAAWLRAGPPAVLSHQGAARFFGLEGSDNWPVVLSAPPGHRRWPSGVIVHESNDLSPAYVTRRSGLSVTTVTRTLVDLGAAVSEVALEVALDDALRRRLTTVAKIQAAIRDLGGRGRPGVRHLRTIVDERAAQDSIADTGFETKVMRVLRKAGLPLPVTQFVIRDPAGVFIMRADMAYAERLLAIEADSERWHMNRQRFRDDRAKRAIAESHGWRVLAFTHGQVEHQPDFVSTTVARALGLA